MFLLGCFCVCVCVDMKEKKRLFGCRFAQTRRLSPCVESGCVESRAATCTPVFLDDSLAESVAPTWFCHDCQTCLETVERPWVRQPWNRSPVFC